MNRKISIWVSFFIFSLGFALDVLALSPESDYRSEPEEKGEITRRTFVKGVAAGAVASVVIPELLKGGTFVAAAIPPEQQKVISGNIAWLNSTLTSQGLPRSFLVPREVASEIWPLTTNEHERMVLNEGLVVYDGALAQLLWALAGDLERAGRLTEVIWEGSLGVLRDLRAYYLAENQREHPFVYTDLSQQKVFDLMPRILSHKWGWGGGGRVEKERRIIKVIRAGKDDVIAVSLKISPLDFTKFKWLILQGRKIGENPRYLTIHLSSPEDLGKQKEGGRPKRFFLSIEGIPFDDEGRIMIDLEKSVQRFEQTYDVKVDISEVQEIYIHIKAFPVLKAGEGVEITKMHLVAKGNEISPHKEGERGFVFKVINAEGKWRTRDPLTGEMLEWSQWQPIAGENAWAGVIGPMQAYYTKYGRKVVPEAVELNLAEEIARVAIILQAENGGVRMGPKGTWHESGRLDFYYNTQSVENNLSWYAAFRMLYEITGKQLYKDAMDKVEGFLKASFDKQRGVFVQGWHYSGGVWREARIFATDCQTWAIDVLGAKRIDEWFGDGTAFKMWQETKRRAGVFSQEGELLGLDFTDVNTSLPEALKRPKMVSVEWSAGGVFACRDMAELYKSTHPEWSSWAADDAKNMIAYIETLKVTKRDGSVGYPYASGRGPSASRATGHGWFAPTQDVESTASTVWMGLVKINYNPFILGGRRSTKTGALPLQRREFLLGPIYGLLRPVESAI